MSGDAEAWQEDDADGVAALGVEGRLEVGLVANDEEVGYGAVVVAADDEGVAVGKGVAPEGVGACGCDVAVAQEVLGEGETSCGSGVTNGQVLEEIVDGLTSGGEYFEGITKLNPGRVSVEGQACILCIATPLISSPENGTMDGLLRESRGDWI